MMLQIGSPVLSSLPPGVSKTDFGLFLFCLNPFNEPTSHSNNNALIVVYSTPKYFEKQNLKKPKISESKSGLDLK